MDKSRRTQKQCQCVVTNNCRTTPWLLMSLNPEQIFVLINEYYTHLLERTAIRIMIVDVLSLAFD